LCRDLSGLKSLGPRSVFFLHRWRHVASARAHAIYAQGSSPSEPVPRPPDPSPPPTNILAGAAQRRLNLATLRSRRLDSARHTVNFGPDDNWTAFGSAHSRLPSPGEPDSHVALAPSSPLAWHSQTAAVRQPAACRPGIAYEPY